MTAVAQTKHHLQTQTKQIAKETTEQSRKSAQMQPAVPIAEQQNTSHWLKLNKPKQVRTSQNKSEHARTCQNMLEQVRTYQNMSEHVGTCQNIPEQV